MSAACCTPAPDSHRGNAAYRRVLWIVLVINAVMFVVEIGAGLAAGSASLQADALVGRPGAEADKLDLARRQLAKGPGICKTAKLTGLGTGTVDKLRREMEGEDTRWKPRSSAAANLER